LNVFYARVKTLGLDISKGWKMKTRNTLVVSAVAAAFALSSAVGIAPAQAYPPGQNLTLTVMENHVLVGEQVVMKVTNAVPNRAVKFTLGRDGKNKVRTVQADENGMVQTFLKPDRFGQFWVTATSGDEMRKSKVWVPKVWVSPKVAGKSADMKVEVRGARPGTVFTFQLLGKSYVSSINVYGNRTYMVTGPAKAGKYKVPVFFGKDWLKSIPFEVK
jgi:hypothetical protein